MIFNCGKALRASYTTTQIEKSNVMVQKSQFDYHIVDEDWVTVSVASRSLRSQAPTAKAMGKVQRLRPYQPVPAKRRGNGELPTDSVGEEEIVCPLGKA